MNLEAMIDWKALTKLEAAEHAEKQYQELCVQLQRLSVERVVRPVNPAVIQVHGPIWTTPSFTFRRIRKPIAVTERNLPSESRSAFRFEKINLHLGTEDYSAPSNWWTCAARLKSQMRPPLRGFGYRMRSRGMADQ